MTLSWKKPIDDGGSKITGFIIEKKTPNSDWTPILEVPDKESSVCLKEGIKENDQCQFRIKAKNSVGLSNPSRPTDLIKIEDQPGLTIITSWCDKRI